MMFLKYRWKEKTCRGKNEAYRTAFQFHDHFSLILIWYLWNVHKKWAKEAENRTSRKKENIGSNAKQEQQHGVYRSTEVWHYRALIISPYPWKWQSQYYVTSRKQQQRWMRSLRNVPLGSVEPFSHFSTEQQEELGCSLRTPRRTNIINTWRASSYALPLTETRTEQDQWAGALLYLTLWRCIDNLAVIKEK